MIQKLGFKNITISKTADRRNARILFRDDAIVGVLEFINKTKVGKRLAIESKEADS